MAIKRQGDCSVSHTAIDDELATHHIGTNSYLDGCCRHARGAIEYSCTRSDAWRCNVRCRPKNLWPLRRRTATSRCACPPEVCQFFGAEAVCEANRYPTEFANRSSARSFTQVGAETQVHELVTHEADFLAATGATTTSIPSLRQVSVQAEAKTLFHSSALSGQASLGSGQIPLGNEARARLFMAWALDEDEKAEQRGSSHNTKEAALIQSSADVVVPTWNPRWTVLRGKDALPGQDVGWPLPGTLLGRAKEFCESCGFGGIVLWGGRCFLRPQTPQDALRSAAENNDAADLLLPPRCPAAHGVSAKRVPATAEPSGNRLRVAILATQDEFDETSVFTLGSVSNTGNGRRYAAQALVRELTRASGVELVAVLLCDWKNVGSEKESRWLVPLEGPERAIVAIRGGTPVVVWRGTHGQLLGAAAGEVQVDVAISMQARYSVVQLMHRAVTAKNYVVMGHDYNLPYGPWGMEADSETTVSHRQLLEDERTTVLCTSLHLTEYLTRHSLGKVRAQLCYCADYRYFSGNSCLWTPPAICNDGDCITFISPCTSKGLPVLLRLCLMLGHLKFLCVSTGWTKTLHEVQLRCHPNVEIVSGSDDLDSLYQRTAVLLMPSLWCEAFGLVAVEAQLRGIPVVSTDACGLSEANFVPELRVSGVPLVHDSRTREIIRGVTMEEAERRLDPNRSAQHGGNILGAVAQRFATTMVASEEEAAGFAAAISNLMTEKSARQEFARLARDRAVAHVESRSGLFLETLRSLAGGASCEQRSTSGGPVFVQ